MMGLERIKWTILEISPRFYEVDSYGIVNNMFYLGWFEMGRFKIAEEAGLIEERVLQEKIMFVVSSIEVNYKQPVYWWDVVSLENLLYWEGGSKLVFYIGGEKKGQRKKWF